MRRETAVTIMVKTMMVKKTEIGLDVVDANVFGPWESAFRESTVARLAWDDEFLHVTVTCGFRDELPRDTDAIELYSVDARYEDSLIRVAVNAAGTLIVMGGGQVVHQPRWGYWHHKDMELNVRCHVTYTQNAWEVQLSIPFAALGLTAKEGTVVPLHLARCEHRSQFAYPNCGCAHGVQRRFWPLGPQMDPHLPLFYPRLMLAERGDIALVPAADATGAIEGRVPATTFTFRGFMLDQSRGALKFSGPYLRRLATRLRNWGIDRFMIYTEGEFAPTAYPMLRKEDSYDSAEFATLSRDMAANGIELVPCHATLGHMDRALTTPGLTHLKENGQDYQLCLAQPGSYEFLGQVIDELCANSSGAFFHANTDESVMLGLCPACQALMAEAGGYGPLLLRHLLWLRERVGRHGRRLLIWADMVLRLPDVLEALPRDVLLADWEYDDFGTYPALVHLKSKGFDVLACPWLTFANHRTYSRAAHAAGVTGFIQTYWSRGNKSLGDAWPAIYHSSLMFGQVENLAPDVIWRGWERLLGVVAESPPLPWEQFGIAIEHPSTLPPEVQLAYCRYFLDRLVRFSPPAETADILYELRRELLIQAWRLRLAIPDETPPAAAELEALADEETAFRQSVAHATATLQDPRLVELREQAAKRSEASPPDKWDGKTAVKEL